VSEKWQADRRNLKNAVTSYTSRQEFITCPNPKQRISLTTQSYSAPKLKSTKRNKIWQFADHPFAFHFTATGLLFQSPASVFIFFFVIMPYILIILSQQLLFFSLHNPFFCFSLFYPSFRLFTCFTFHLKAYLPAIQQFCLRVFFFFVTQFKYFSYLSFFPSIFNSRCLSIYFSPTSILVFPVFLALSPLCHSVWPVILWSLKCGIFFPFTCPYFFCFYLYSCLWKQQSHTQMKRGLVTIYVQCRHSWSLYTIHRQEIFLILSLVPYHSRKCYDLKTEYFFSSQNFDLTSSISRWTVIKLQV